MRVITENITGMEEQVGVQNGEAYGPLRALDPHIMANQATINIGTCKQMRMIATLEAKMGEGVVLIL